MKKNGFPVNVSPKEYIGDIAKGLLKQYGKKRFYKAEEVNKVHKESKWIGDVERACWAICIFSTQKEFERYYRSEKALDYFDMRAQILNESFESKQDDDYSIFENIIQEGLSWLDFGDFFEGIFEGIGDFIGGILEIIDF